MKGKRYPLKKKKSLNIHAVVFIAPEGLGVRCASCSVLNQKGSLRSETYTLVLVSLYRGVCPAHQLAVELTRCVLISRGGTDLGNQD